MMFSLLSLLLAAHASANDLPDCDLSKTGRSAHLLTIASAPQADRAFGHTGLLLYEPQYGGDSVVYDFGNFDASDPVGVVTDLVTGSQEYLLVKKRLSRTIEHYGEGHGRRIELQELRLTDAQFEELAQVLYRTHEETPQFAYNWYLPNCTTRVRDVLDDVMGGALRPQHQGSSGLSPARQVLRHSANLLPMWFGLHWGSGGLADQDIPWWDAMFLPITLAQRLDASTVQTEAGDQPLVVSTCVAAIGRTDPIPDKAPNHDLWLWAMGLMAGLGVFGVGRTRAALPLVATQGLAVGVFGCAALLVGVMGTFAPFWTHHNLYFANPLHLGLFAAAALAFKSPLSVVPERIAASLVGIGGIGVLASLANGLADRNFGLFGLMLPIGMAAVLTLRHRRMRLGRDT